MKLWIALQGHKIGLVLGILVLSWDFFYTGIRGFLEWDIGIVGWALLVIGYTLTYLSRKFQEETGTIF